MAKNDFDFDDFDFGEILKDDKKPELGFVKRGDAGTNAKIENVMIVGSSEMYGFVESTFGMLYEKFRREPLKEFRQISI